MKKTIHWGFGYCVGALAATTAALSANDGHPWALAGVTLTVIGFLVVLADD